MAMRRFVRDYIRPTTEDRRSGHPFASESYDIQVTLAEFPAFGLLLVDAESHRGLSRYGHVKHQRIGLPPSVET